MKVFKGDCWEEELDATLEAMEFAFQSTVSLTVDYSPAQLAFGWDMILGWKVAVDFDQVKQQCANKAKCNNQKENATQIDD